jgi:zinc protease
VAFSVMTGQLKVALANRSVLPDTAFDEALDAALSQNHFRAQPMTAARVDQMSLDKSLTFYKDRFADASDFTFVFVGSFDLPTMKPSSAVPGQPAGPPQARDGEGHRHPSADRRGSKAGEKRDRAKEPGSIVFTGPFKNDAPGGPPCDGGDAERHPHRTLREDLGGTYGVSVEPSFTKRPAEEYACDQLRLRPGSNRGPREAAFQLIEQFQTPAPAEGRWPTARALLRDFETNSQRNEYLLNRILFKYEYGEDLSDVFSMRRYYDQLTAPLLRDAARLYLNTNRYVEVTLMPEGK